MSRAQGPTGWEEWERSWRSVDTVPQLDLDRVIAQTARARRSTAGVRSLETLIALFALFIIASALAHAANRYEAVLGLSVGTAIGALWLYEAQIERGARRALGAPLPEYLLARRTLCLQRIRFARFGWAILALDLAFLIPWWAVGTVIHGWGLHFIPILTIWAPLASMLAFVLWTVRVRANAEHELRTLPEATEA